jgi:hypothetical protein
VTLQAGTINRAQLVGGASPAGFTLSGFNDVISVGTVIQVSYGTPLGSISDSTTNGCPANPPS